MINKLTTRPVPTATSQSNGATPSGRTQSESIEVATPPPAMSATSTIAGSAFHAACQRCRRRCEPAAASTPAASAASVSAVLAALAARGAVRCATAQRELGASLDGAQARAFGRESPDWMRNVSSSRSLAISLASMAEGRGGGGEGGGVFGRWVGRM